MRVDRRIQESHPARVCAMAHANLAMCFVDQGSSTTLSPKTPRRLGSSRATPVPITIWPGSVLSPKRPRPDYEEGLVHARRAAELAPKDGNIFNMLLRWPSIAVGTGRSRWPPASGRLRLAGPSWTGSSRPWRRSEGRQSAVRSWFDEGVEQTRQFYPSEGMLRQFCRGRRDSRPARTRRVRAGPAGVTLPGKAR